MKRLYIITDKDGFGDLAHLTDEEVAEARAAGFEVNPFNE